MNARLTQRIPAAGQAMLLLPSRSISAIAATLIALAVAGGCRSLAELAPPVEPHWAAEPGSKIAALERGREIYITTCASCHQVMAIGDLSLEKWQAVLPEMVEESSLDAGRSADLKAYVLAARQWLEATRPGDEDSTRR
ncbi:MAG: cytochrome c [Planctomycetota bacterium]